jgi:two-component sensor histidine kinase
MKELSHIQSQETIAKTINRCCFVIAVSSLLNMIMYAFLGLYNICGLLTLIGLLFLFFIYLNNKSYHVISRLGIIITTNMVVFLLSVFLGFNSGVYLFLLAAPHLIYLLYNFEQKSAIFACFASYLLTFALIYVIHRYHIIESISLPEHTMKILYVINFSFSLAFCFILITFLAGNNNDKFTNIILETNKALQEKQTDLQNEISEKNRSNEALIKIVDEKEILLSEIHHRVKTNLAFISGLIELQNFYVKDEKTSLILRASRNRIKSIAVLHEKFYENKSLGKIEIRSYVDELIYFIKLSFSSQKKEIKIHTHIDYVELSMGTALPFSLLLNELITNSYKHAFKEKDKGNIYMSLIKKQDELTLNFKDDGCGFDLSESIKEDFLGMNLIDAFSKQLKAQMTYQSKIGEGTELKIKFRQG